MDIRPVASIVQKGVWSCPEIQCLHTEAACNSFGHHFQSLQRALINNFMVW